MADYRRKRKDGRSYRAGGKTAGYKRKPYAARLGGLGGGSSYGAPRNYYRTHDFRYEREPELKPPKTETHYTIERPIEPYRPPPYRSEFDQTEMEKIVGETIEKYRRHELELEVSNQTQNEFETPSLQEKNVEAKPGEESVLAETNEIPLEGNLDTATGPPPEVVQEANMVTDKAPEVYESFELPIADLELLLIELEANPLDTPPEKIVEPEGAVEHQ